MLVIFFFFALSIPSTFVRGQNMQLLTDARAARMYRDELDAMKERAIRADKLESEVARYREKLHNMNFYKVKLEVCTEQCLCVYAYTTIQEFGVGKICLLCFWKKSLRFTKAAGIWSKTVKTVILWNITI